MRARDKADHNTKQVRLVPGNQAEPLLLAQTVERVVESQANQL